MLKQKCKHASVRIMAYYKLGSGSKARCNDCNAILTAKPVKIEWKEIKFESLDSLLK